MPLPQKILTRKHEITAQVFNLLDQHIDDILAGKINYAYKIKDFAARLFIHPTHFTNTIKLTTKRSPYDFVEERIVAEAKRMLSETSMSIAEISHTLTFQDATNFTKFFKRVEGKSPDEYRRCWGAEVRSVGVVWS
jgi:AraC-like DNA-binding protein